MSRRNRHNKTNGKGSKSVASPANSKGMNAQSPKSSSKGDKDFPTHRVVKGELEGCHTNDISWYNKSPLFEDATDIPFNRIAGDVISFNSPTVLTAPTNEAISGAMSIYFVPGIGWAEDANSPVNRAFNSMWNAMLSRTAGIMQFQQADLALFVLAMSSILSIFAMLRRALGLSQIYISKNYYYPDGALESVGVTPASVLGKQNDLRQRLNQIILNFNGIDVPSFVDVFKRHYSLCLNMWADEDNVESQVYAFVPTGYYEYEDTLSKLTWREFTVDVLGKQKPRDFDYYLDIVDSLLEVWRNSSDFGLINGSIQRAYPESDLLKLELVPRDYVTIPVADPVMLAQISNMVTATNLDPLSLDVTQEPAKNNMIWMPKLKNMGPNDVKAARPQLIEIRFLNAQHASEINKDFVMESTRLMTFVRSAWGQYYLTNCCSEIPVGWRIWTRQKTNAGVSSLAWIDGTSFTTILDTSNADLITALKGMSQLSKFRYGPLCYLMTITAADVITYLGTLGDMGVYTTVEFTGYTGLSNAALQSMYAIQSPPKVIK